MARRYFPGRAPGDVIGRRIMWYQSPDPQWVTVVGIVNDVRSFGLERAENPATYVPFTQRTLPFLRWMTFVARVSGNPASAFSPMRSALLDVDPEQPVTAMTTLDAAMRMLLAERRFNMLLMTIFAGVGVLLATVGLFGMLSFAVAQRTREIGVRMALGARRADVIRMILADSARLSVAGLAIGGLAAVAAARAIRSMLFGVTPVDPATFGAVTVVVAAVALIASYVPARRAASVDPVIVMRE
jgi:predicted lysophospholipase L1 biosynthesis ABC-type transport system permease subunit